MTQRTLNARGYIYDRDTEIVKIILHTAQPLRNENARQHKRFFNT